MNLALTYVFHPRTWWTCYISQHTAGFIHFQGMAGLIIFIVHVSNKCNMFIQYINVVKCYYGSSNDCEIIIPPTQTLTAAQFLSLTWHNCLWLNWRFHILLFSFRLSWHSAAMAQVITGPTKSPELPGKQHATGKVSRGFQICLTPIFPRKRQKSQMKGSLIK